MVADPDRRRRTNARRRHQGEWLLSWLNNPDAIPPANRAERRLRAQRDRRRIRALRRHLIEVERKREERARRRLRREQRLAG